MREKPIGLRRFFIHSFSCSLGLGTTNTSICCRNIQVHDGYTISSYVNLFQMKSNVKSITSTHQNPRRYSLDLTIACGRGEHTLDCNVRCLLKSTMTHHPVRGVSEWLHGSLRCGIRIECPGALCPTTQRRGLLLVVGHTPTSSRICNFGW
ncbi:hypothetical protein EV424DRAFT_121589 [Suillus variegatus]|nr:hypothetical protein EV424DRAFT_121589 [Suillus variegatus]